jgi:hypothetical protein
MNKMLLVVATLLLIVCGTSAFVDVCDIDSSVDISKSVLSPNGDILYRGIKYTKNQYYYDVGSGVLRGCQCRLKKCVRKCCPFGQGYNSLSKSCVNVTEAFNPPVWNKYKKLNFRATDKFRFVIGKVNCSGPDEYRVRLGQVANQTHLLQVKHYLYNKSFVLVFCEVNETHRRNHLSSDNNFILNNNDYSKYNIM